MKIIQALARKRPQIYLTTISFNRICGPNLQCGVTDIATRFSDRYSAKINMLQQKIVSLGKFMVEA